MAASATLIELEAVGTVTISLAPSGTGIAAGSGRASDAITNSGKFPAATIFCEIKSGGSAPAATGVYSIYLLRRDAASGPAYGTDNWAGSDAALTRVNAKLLGTIRVTNNANTVFSAEFQTDVVGVLGEVWGIGFVNDTSQGINNTGGDHSVTYRYYYPEAQ